MTTPCPDKTVFMQLLEQINAMTGHATVTFQYRPRSEVEMIWFASTYDENHTFEVVGGSGEHVLRKLIAAIKGGA